MDELNHSGIKGMRWGIRRYRKEDGTLTEEGKKRYNKDYTPERTGQDSSAYKNHAVNAKYVREHQQEMTDDQLRAALNRIDMQTKLRTLAPTRREQTAAVLKKYKTQIVTGLVAAAAGATVTAVIKSGKKIGSSKKVKDAIDLAKTAVGVKALDIYSKLFKK